MPDCQAILVWVTATTLAQRSISLRTNWENSCALLPTGTKPSFCRRLRMAGEATPAMRKRLQNEGLVPVGSSAQEFSQFVRKEIDRWAKVVAVTHTKIA